MMVEQTLFPTRDPELVWRELDEELVIVRPSDGQIKVLNGVGAFVWQSLDGRRAVGDLAELVSAEYEISAQEAKSDIEDFLGQLTEGGLVQ